ncbi:DEHA2G12782p [Debaryomyces hansenii CBS767]|uniref:DEHA2G12782p n=1 Tax=Debaryomyces hansenii (strain ATCC 36239 / CBS 767 / BCRC 21394 / JCM 1990 / NBRC 0083 / IGC 2968) TaxID=284592 RepID=B5RUR7_DEBHA|nr:DEHA2G12782p [Debaryomyces hansenii CBS767]CAR65961.1 DEHA2G12782p [Debaryomyces hansenii CBS767]|eukprot:XP_002770627.1 DEHA2G12782p [Debaryomyces hansenii CBS767]
MNLDALNGSDLNGAFKIANLAVAGLSILSGLSQLFSGIQSFVLGIYIIAFGGVIGLLEFRVPAEAYAYASFLFSFIGRGIFYTLIGASINGGSAFRIIAGLLIFVVGLVYISLEAIPSISPPENMNPEGIAIGINDEDII